MLKDKEIIEIAKKKVKMPYWALWLIPIIMLLSIMIANTIGVVEGYNDAYKDNQKQQNLEQQKNNWESYTYNEKTELFWSEIMWAIMTNLKTLFLVTTIVLVLFAITR